MIFHTNCHQINSCTGKIQKVCIIIINHINHYQSGNTKVGKLIAAAKSSFHSCMPNINDAFYPQDKNSSVD